MTFLFFLPFITSFSANAAPEANNIPKEEPRFHIQVKRNEFSASIRSQDIQSYVELMPEEEDYTAPFQIEIFDLNTESSNSTYTVHHRYHIHVSCHTMGGETLDTLDYRYWTKSVPLYEQNRVFLSDDKEFLNREIKRNYSPLEAFLGSNGKAAACSWSIEESVYTIEKEGTTIKDIILILDQGGC